jgi:hypothetical protein
MPQRQHVVPACALACQQFGEHHRRADHPAAAVYCNCGQHGIGVEALEKHYGGADLDAKDGGDQSSDVDQRHGDDSNIFSIATKMSGYLAEC